MTPVTPNAGPSPAKDTLPVNADAPLSVMLSHNTAQSLPGQWPDSPHAVQRLAGLNSLLQARRTTHVLALRAASYSRSAKCSSRFNPASAML